MPQIKRYITQPSEVWRRALAGGPSRYGFPTPSGHGLGNVLTASFDSLFGLTPGPSTTPDYLTQAATLVQNALTAIFGKDSDINGYLAQSHPFDSSSNNTLVGRAAAVEAEATGLLNVYDTLISNLNSLSLQITQAQSDLAAVPTSSDQSAPGQTVGSTSAAMLTNAQGLYSEAQTYSSQASDLVSNVSQLKSDTADLISYSQGKGISATLSALGSSIGGTLSTSTYLIAGAIALGIVVFMISPKARGAARVAAL